MLEISSETQAKLSDVISIADTRFESEIYIGENLITNPLNLRFKDVQNSKEEETFEFSLLQNEPNPFGQGTVIGFELEKENQAKLTIYDATGRIYFVAEERFEAGRNEIEIKTEILSGSGIYYYKLELGNQIEIKRMIVIE